MPPNASSLELAWTSIGGAGFLFAIAMEVLVFRSLRAVHAWIEQGRSKRYGPRHRFALGFVTCMGILTLFWAGWIALGVNAIANPPALEEVRAASSERAGWLLVALGLLLLLFQAALLYVWVAVGGPSSEPPVAKVAPS